MTEEHLKKVEAIQEFMLEQACYIKSEIEKHENMPQCMYSQALDDMKDSMKTVMTCETIKAMVHDPQRLNPAMVK